MLTIANAAGFWGDSLAAPRALLERSRVKYLTLEYLAELTSLDLSYAQRVERGEINLTLSSLANFADAFGVQPGVLLRAGKPPLIRRGRPKAKRAESPHTKK